MSDYDRSTRWLRYGLLVVLVALVLGASFGAGVGLGLYVAPGQNQPAGVADEQQEQFGIFWEAWEIVRRDFFHPESEPQPLEMTYGAIRGMVASMGDPNTLFVEPAQTSIWEQDLQGEFEGIGATVNMKDGRLVIVQPLPGSPAEKAGLLPDDVVLTVDGQSIEGMELLDAINLIRGPEGTVVILGISREGHDGVIDVSMERGMIELATLDAEMLDDGIAYVRLREFNGRADSLMRSALERLMNEEPKGLILDLRSNPGGFLGTAVDIGGQFIDKGVILIERSKNGVEREHRARKGGLATEVPLVVLVNGSSASASEIVAAAVQDHKRGILVGQPTHGKGSVQNSHHLSDGSSIRVTVSRWYTPNDHEISPQGLTPDILVERKADDGIQGRDPQLDRAREYLLALDPGYHAYDR